MMGVSIVIDTCVFISALRSNQGASFKILSMIGGGQFEFSLSVALVLEYETVAKRKSQDTGLTDLDVENLIDYMCAVGKPRQVHFLWRPNLKDPSDDFVLELAVESGCDYIVTHNIRDFVGIDKFKVKAITPQEFLRVIGVIS